MSESKITINTNVNNISEKWVQIEEILNGMSAFDVTCCIMTILAYFAMKADMKVTDVAKMFATLTDEFECDALLKEAGEIVVKMDLDNEC